MDGQVIAKTLELMNLRRCDVYDFVPSFYLYNSLLLRNINEINTIKVINYLREISSSLFQSNLYFGKAILMNALRIKGI